MLVLLRVGSSKKNSISPSRNKLKNTPSLWTLVISTWPLGPGQHTGEDILRVRVVLRELWALFVFLAEALFPTSNGRDYLSIVKSIWYVFRPYWSIHRVIRPYTYWPDSISMGKTSRWHLFCLRAYSVCRNKTSAKVQEQRVEKNGIFSRHVFFRVWKQFLACFVSRQYEKHED